MRKSGIVATLVTLLLFSILPVFQASAETAFPDVAEGHWAEKEIYTLVEQEVLNGFDDGTFRPNQAVTRAQAAIMLTNALNLDTAVAEPSYQDVEASHYAYDAIAAVTAAGIMSGSYNQFNPNQSLTRAEMAAVLTDAFSLEATGEASFTDVADSHWAKDAIDAIYSNGITEGYQDGTYAPSKATTRAEFAVLLVKTLQSGDTEDLASLLKEVYANELEIESYDFAGDLEMGISLPASFTDIDPEFAMIAGVLEDISVEIKNGTYQLDPMQLEMVLAVTLGGDMNVTLEMPVVMTETKMWLKMPNSPLFPLPEELNGKFIEYDLEELAELEGQDPFMMNLDLQTELAAAIYDLFFDHFTDGFYEQVALNAIDYPNSINAKHVVKFELTNEKLEEFLTVFIGGFMPDMIDLMADPEFAELFGITVEDAELVKEELDALQLELQTVLTEIENVLNIKKFEEYVVIDRNHYLAYNQFNLDLEFAFEDETLGLVINGGQSKSRINEEPNFSIGIPDADSIITLDELMEVEY